MDESRRGVLDGQGFAAGAGTGRPALARRVRRNAMADSMALEPR
jgi:hypothetical protein